MTKFNFFKIFKIILAILSIYFIHKVSKENYKEVVENIDIEIYWLILILVLRILLHNLLSFRMFSFLKLTSIYSSKFIDWSCLYFLTGLINSSPLWGGGHIIRSHEMKQHSYSIKEYVCMHYFIFFWGILINSFLMLFLLIVYKEQQNIYIFSSLLILLTISILSISTKIINLFGKFVQKFKSNSFFLKFGTFDYIVNKIDNIIKISNNILRPDVFIPFLIITIFLFIFEYLILFLVFKYLFQVTDLNIVSMFFVLNYLIKKTPSLDGIIGLKESLLGLFAQFIGLLFIEGVIVTITIRLLNITSAFINYIIFFLLARIY